ncbi:MAG: recombination mediator RecR [candidate division KSB1 bacterium]|nr:recombination mediator RecR [candidate division KSB1 bacterium]
MEYIADAIKIAIEEFAKLPGIGRKTAQRLVFFLIKRKPEELDALAHAIASLKDRVRYCSICYNLTEADPCGICSHPGRDPRIICVVEEPNDVVAIEKTHEFKGVYHVLGGALSPLEGIGPNDLRIKELLQRLQGDVEEVIIATNANAEGEATAVYLSKLIKPMGIRITRIAHGVPVGGDLEFTDEVTLARALTGRTEM